VVCQFFNGFACRTERESLFKVGLLKNKALLYSEMFGIALIAAISYLPPLQHLFKTGPLSGDDWLLLLAAGVSLFFAEEARKWVARLRAAQPGKEA
jgi:magnesium-transporting ATPase (P-type)